MANYQPAGFEDDLSDEEFVFGDDNYESKGGILNGSNVATLPTSQPPPNPTIQPLQGKDKGGFGKPPPRPNKLQASKSSGFNNKRQEYSAVKHHGLETGNDNSNKVTSKPVYMKSQPIPIQGNSNAATGSPAANASNSGKPAAVGKSHGSQGKSKSKMSSKAGPADLGIVPVEDFKTAVMRGNIDTVEKFLQRGIPVDTIFSSGWTALMYAACAGELDCIKVLLEHKADSNFNKDMYTVLMAACASTKGTDTTIEQCVRLLIDNKADCNAFDRHHMSPLMYAARAGRVAVVKCLLEQGVNMDKQDSNGYTALIFATVRSHARVVQALIEGGADLNKKSCDGSSALDWASINGYKQIEELLRDTKGATDTNPVSPKKEEEACSPTVNGIAGEPTASSTQSISQYGDLEIFLSGLELSHLVPVFHTHQIAFKELLRLTDTDLQQLGIAQLGPRKKILDGVRETHKKDWETSSVISPQYNKQITCAEAIAMVTNIKKHSSYIASTIGYISDQIKADKKILVDAQGGATAEELAIQSEEAITNVRFLHEELVLLRQYMAQVQGKKEYSPPDLIQDGKLRASRSRQGSYGTKLVLTTVLGGIVYWKWNEVSSAAEQLSQRLFPKG